MIEAYEEPVVVALLSAMTRPRRHPATMHAHSVIQQASRHQIPHFGRRLAGYSWGTSGLRVAGDERRPTVLLVHGWESQAAYFDLLITALRQNEVQVFAHDAPAHGASPGEQTDVMAMGEAIISTAEYFGRIDAVVAHSVGSPASLYAFARGLNVKASVHLGGPSSMVRAVRRAAAQARLSEAAIRDLEMRFEQQVGRPLATMDVSSLAHGLDHPALLMHDLHDAEVPYSEAAALAAAWPDAVLVPITGVGHRQMAKEGRVIEHILSFLTATAFYRGGRAPTP